MSTLTVRNLDDVTKGALAARAAANGRSMEAEARMILADAVRTPEPGAAGGLGTRIHERFADLDWEPLPRQADEPRPAAFG